MTENKIRCNKRVYPSIHTEEYYVLTDSHKVCLRDQMTRTPSLANLPIRITPPGTPSTTPLNHSIFAYLSCSRFFLDHSDTITTAILAPIITMMMLRECVFRNTGSMCKLKMMRSSMKTPHLIKFTLVPVEPHSFSSLLISNKMVARAFPVVWCWDAED